jgi:hypothetical protein
MKRATLILASMLVLLGLLTPQSAQATYYIVASNGDFGTLNPLTGVYTHIAITTPIFTSLTSTPNGTLYGEATDLHLYTINPTTGATTQVGTTTAPAPVLGLAAQSNATLLGFTGVFPPNFYSIPANGGSFTQLGTFNQSFETLGNGTMAFGPDGSLYFDASFDESGSPATLFSVNPANGNLTQIGSNLGSPLLSLSTDTTILYGVDTIHTTNIGIYNIKFTLGTTLLVATLTGLPPGVHENAIAEIPTPVPEPSTLTLIGIGSLSLLGYGWRRRKQAA